MTSLISKFSIYENNMENENIRNTLINYKMIFNNKFNNNFIINLKIRIF